MFVDLRAFLFSIENLINQMLRRCFLRRCTTGHTTGEWVDPKAPSDGVRIQDAFALFGFRMDEVIDHKDLKKRYTKLMLKHHPDQGGTAQMFRMVQQSYKLLKRHEKDPETKKPRFEFKKMDADEGSGWKKKGS